MYLVVLGIIKKVFANDYRVALLPKSYLIAIHAKFKINGIISKCLNLRKELKPLRTDGQTDPNSRKVQGMIIR